MSAVMATGLADDIRLAAFVMESCITSEHRRDT